MHTLREVDTLARASGSVIRSNRPPALQAVALVDAFTVARPGTLWVTLIYSFIVKTLYFGLNVELKGFLEQILSLAALVLGKFLV